MARGLTASAAGDSRCPRCGAAFHCGIGDAGPCPCATAKLDRDTLAELRQRFSCCLCLGCLEALARGAPANTTPPPDDATALR